MVHGLEMFQRYFRGNTHQYVFIGGTACDILLGELGVPFRSTKDLDMVLIMETLDKSFGERFWEFIVDGGYEHREKASGESQYYRFSRPADLNFPSMIELFSRKPDDLHLGFDTGLTPLHIDDDMVSLSAILLNDVYYQCLLRGMQVMDGYSIVDMETIILFKIKAWVDLTEKRDCGVHVDSNNIKKHKNDIFRLLANVSPSVKVEVSEEIGKDLARFMEKINLDRPDLNKLGVRGTSFEEQIELLGNIYFVTEGKS